MNPDQFCLCRSRLRTCSGMETNQQRNDGEDCRGGECRPGVPMSIPWNGPGPATCGGYVRTDPDRQIRARLNRRERLTYSPGQSTLFGQAGPAIGASVNVRRNAHVALEDILELFFRQMAHRLGPANPISLACDSRWCFSTSLARLVRLLTVPTATPVISATS